MKVKCQYCGCTTVPTDKGTCRACAAPLPSISAQDRTVIVPVYASRPPMLHPQQVDDSVGLPRQAMSCAALVIGAAWILGCIAVVALIGGSEGLLIGIGAMVIGLLAIEFVTRSQMSPTGRREYDQITEQVGSGRLGTWAIGVFVVAVAIVGLLIV